MVRPVLSSDYQEDDANYQLLDVKEATFKAWAKIRRLSDDHIYVMEIPVRYTHPGFFLRKVAFIPS